MTSDVPNCAADRLPEQGDDTFPSGRFADARRGDLHGACAVPPISVLQEKDDAIEGDRPLAGDGRRRAVLTQEVPQAVSSKPGAPPAPASRPVTVATGRQRRDNAAR